MSIEEDPNAKYDLRRCRVCGEPWLPHTDDQGRLHRGHLPGKTCSQYRPEEAAVEPPVFTGINGVTYSVDTGLRSQG